MTIQYEGVILEESDMQTLLPSCFLSDKVIEFYFAYLASYYKSDAVKLVDPTLSSWLSGQDDVSSFADNLSTKSLVLFAVNDSDGTYEGGTGSGTHWSLLVYHRAMNKFIHYDTLGETNHVAAEKLYDAVKSHMGPGGQASKLQTSKKKDKKKKSTPSVCKPSAPAGLPLFDEPKDTPQQSTQFDCGLYVLAIAEAICEWLTREMSIKLDSVAAKHVDQSVEFHMRAKVESIIKKVGTLH